MNDYASVKERENRIIQELPHYEDVEQLKGPGYAFILACGAVLTGLILFAVSVPHIVGFIRGLL